MTTIKWANVLHWYQPPWQEPAVLELVTNESYSFLVKHFKRYPHFRATINIAGTLIESLLALKKTTLIDDLRMLVGRGQIELMGSSYHHAFLPQLPEAEIRRQVELQEKILSDVFGIGRPSGFFAPELAYSPALGTLIKAVGYQWIILDPISTRANVTPDVKYLSRRTGLTVLFRDRAISNSYPPEELFNMAERGASATVITATDGELYGHAHKDWQNHLTRLLSSSPVTILTASEYLASLKKSQPIYLRAASWQTRSKHITTNNPFTVWYNKQNNIHRLLWQLAHLAIECVGRAKHDPNYEWARTHLDRGLSSCTWWWASEVKTSPFAPIAWHPDNIERGALELMRSIRSLAAGAADEKIRAESLYAKLTETLWIKHWKLYG